MVANKQFIPLNLENGAFLFTFRSLIKSLDINLRHTAAQIGIQLYKQLLLQVIIFSYFD